MYNDIYWPKLMTGAVGSHFKMHCILQRYIQDLPILRFSQITKKFSQKFSLSQINLLPKMPATIQVYVVNIEYHYTT